ncbi:hypothetical protein BD413DRAFT_491803 [Trametes elegans]|nr:hypothetical protein BD413DRAFT_491803 [Trametes elegans]
MASVQTLPPELWDQVVDNLHDDKPALRACALLGRTWHPRAQRYLFRSIYLDWSNCYAFSSLVASNPFIAELVGTLEIEGAFGIFSMDRLHGATLDAWLRAVPDWLPPRLFNLAKLELALLTVDGELVRRFFSHLRGVTHLTLWACALTTFDVFAEMFFAFPQIKRLSIAYTQEWEANPQAVVRRERRAAPRPQLEVVEFTSCCENFKVLSWLVAEDLHRTVKALSCTRMTWAALPALNDALQAFAPTLQSFRFSLGDAASAVDLPEGGEGWVCPPFKPLTALTTLTLDIHTTRLSMLPYELFLLSRLSAPALRTLVLSVKLGEIDTTPLLPWAHIAEIAARFAGEGVLRRVLVSVRARESADADLVWLDARRPIAAVDLEEMERSVRRAFAAQGMADVVEFEHVAQ